jgi:hypothetical protein
MGNDHRQCVGMSRAHVDEVDVQAVDLRHELRQGVELGLGLAPVIVCAPIADERFHIRKWYALRLVVHGLPVGPTGHEQTPAKIGKIVIGHIYAKGPDGVARTSRSGSGRRPGGADREAGRRCWRQAQWPRLSGDCVGAGRPFPQLPAPRFHSSRAIHLPIACSFDVLLKRCWSGEGRNQVLRREDGMGEAGLPKFFAARDWGGPSFHNRTKRTVRLVGLPLSIVMRPGSLPARLNQLDDAMEDAGKGDAQPHRLSLQARERPAPSASIAVHPR